MAIFLGDVQFVEKSADENLEDNKKENNEPIFADDHRAGPSLETIQIQKIVQGLYFI